ncbi:unnamed protein product [Heligmosomoides polygyrus]|uniref:GCV_T domain-containing protein n=1 Tax=Heligmosomoides polygyrus TaxID=6339 RepID=A0A183FLL5_HELPZ|nr:unnamed protein product [Heligmosomoides polygyrus]
MEGLFEVLHANTSKVLKEFRVPLRKMTYYAENDTDFVGVVSIDGLERAKTYEVRVGAYIGSYHVPRADINVRTSDEPEAYVLNEFSVVMISPEELEIAWEGLAEEYEVSVHSVV